MGAASSKKKKAQDWSWSGPPGDHSPLPLDKIPRPELELRYCFIDIMVSHRIMRNKINLGPAAVATNVEEFLDQITDCYQEGFVLNKFIRVPGAKMTIDIADWSKTQPYQAILSKPVNRPVFADKEEWELKVEKRILSTKTLAFDESPNESDLISTIEQYSRSGARLLCAEPVGYVRSTSTNTQYGIIGVELFFNVPKHEKPTRYTYHTIKIPAKYEIVPDATQTIQQVMCDADFLGQLTLFLNCGWKLVDIGMDATAIADAYKFHATSKIVDTMWIFEKETERLLDDTPIYEGAIIEYLHKVQSTSDSELPCRDWRPVIAGMGISGWELASIIQTPLLLQSSFRTFTIKLLLIFQRRLQTEKSKTRSEEYRLLNSVSHSSKNIKGDHVSSNAVQGPPADERTRKADAGKTQNFGRCNSESTANGPITNGYVCRTVNGVKATSSSNSPNGYWSSSDEDPYHSPNDVSTTSPSVNDDYGNNLIAHRIAAGGITPRRTT